MSVRRSLPPPLPSEILLRTIRTASIDGRLVLWLAGCGAFFCAARHEVAGAIAGIAAAGAGGIELHGATLLSSGESRGVNWLVRAQLLLLATVLIYSAMSLNSFDPELVRKWITPDLQKNIQDIGLTEDQYIDALKVLYQALYVIVGCVTLFYQSAMARFYSRRRPAIELALQETAST